MEHENVDKFLRESQELFGEAGALAKSLAPKILVFEAQCELRVNEVLREKMVEEIERTVAEAATKAQEDEDRIRRLRVLKEETWIRAFPFEVNGDTMIGFGAMRIPASTRSAARRRVVAGMEKTHVRWLPVLEFIQRTEKLKSVLLKGDLDDALRLDPERVLYEIMNPNGKLCPRLQSD